jgi:hypothetical protein
MKHTLFILTALALAACGTAEKPVAAAEQVAADAASAAYATCVDKEAALVDLAADQPAALTDRAMKACRDARAEVVTKVTVAQVAAGKDAATAASVAEQSVRVADSELRSRANTAIVTRKLKAN